MTDWLKEIKQHHKGIKAAFQTAIKFPTKANVKELELLIDAHSIAEEACIYPLLKRHGMDDENLEKEQTDAKLTIHYLAKNFDKLKGFKKGKELYVVAELMDLLADVLLHAKVHEEADKFKKLHKDMTPDDIAGVGKQYMKVYKEWME